MRKYIRTYVLFFMISISGTRSLISLVTNDLGFNNFQIGWLVALYSITPLSFAVKLGNWIDNRKNWLFSAAYEEAKSAAVTMNPIETAKQNHLVPEKYSP